MCRAIIIDNLNDCFFKTIKCKDEETAKNECREAIKRLNKKARISMDNNRFEFYCIKIDK